MVPSSRSVPPLSSAPAHSPLDTFTQSAMNIDKPLDDIITSKRSAKRGSSSRGGPGGAARTARGGGGRAPAPAGGVGPQRNARGSAAAAAPARPAQPQFAPDTIPGDKVVVSNLPEDVTEAQIRVGADAATLKTPASY